MSHRIQVHQPSETGTIFEQRESQQLLQRMAVFLLRHSGIQKHVCRQILQICPKDTRWAHRCLSCAQQKLTFNCAHRIPQFTKSQTRGVMCWYLLHSC